MNRDPWSQLRQHTTARIAIGRAGTSLPTTELLQFAADHADARDAVHSELNVQTLVESLTPLGLSIITLRSRAKDRASYLRNPDLGRRLDEPSAATVTPNAKTDVDLALIVGDGLSAVAVQRHAAPVLDHLLPLLQARRISLGPVCIVTQARVAIQDEIGSLLKARVAVILLGERPGLAAVDSVGAYLVHAPSIGNTDANRNCISNIRPSSLKPSEAANALAWLIEQSLARRISGVSLKDDRHPTIAIGQRPTLD